jgi:hypothetical protein
MIQTAVWILVGVAFPGGACAESKPAVGEPRLQGMYQVVASNDPMFSMTDGKEWFLDFGEGLKSAKRHGNVAISMRQNPSVRVRMMVWQFYPEPRQQLVIGNPCHEGATSAVIAGHWQMKSVAGGIILERGEMRVVLRATSDP